MLWAASAPEELPSVTDIWARQQCPSVIVRAIPYIQGKISLFLRVSLLKYMFVLLILGRKIFGFWVKV